MHAHIERLCYGCHMTDALRPGLADLLGDLPPGPALAAALAEVPPLAELCSTELALVVVARSRQLNHDEGEFMAAVLELGLTPQVWQTSPIERDAKLDRHTSGLVGPVVNWTYQRAEAYLHVADDIVRRLPMVHAGMLAGRIDHDKARVFFRQLVHLETHLAQRIADRFVDRCANWTVEQLRDHLHRAVMKADPETARKRRDTRVADRSVWFGLDADGTGRIDGSGLPAQVLIEAKQNVNRLARAAKAAGDPRTMRQLMADVVGDLLRCIPFRTTPTIDPITARADAEDLVDRAALIAEYAASHQARSANPLGATRAGGAAAPGLHTRPAASSANGARPGALDRASAAHAVQAHNSAQATHSVQAQHAVQAQQAVQAQHAGQPQHAVQARHAGQPQHAVQARNGFRAPPAPQAQFESDDSPPDDLDALPPDPYGWEWWREEWAAGYEPGPYPMRDLPDDDPHPDDPPLARYPGYTPLGSTACPTCQRIVTPDRRSGTIDIIVTLETLMMLNDQPGLVPGWGPVQADICRQVALDPDAPTRWLFTVLDHHNRPLTQIRTKRRPTLAEASIVRMRDTYCRAPGCQQPAYNCDNDHCQADAEGGIATRANLARLCRFHHVLKHRGALRYEISINGSVFWRFPDGRMYIVPPHGLPWYVDDDLDATPTPQPTNQIIPRTRLDPETSHSPIPLDHDVPRRPAAEDYVLTQDFTRTADELMPC